MWPVISESLHVSKSWSEPPGSDDESLELRSLAAFIDTGTLVVRFFFRGLLDSCLEFLTGSAGWGWDSALATESEVGGAWSSSEGGCGEWRCIAAEGANSFMS